MISHEMGYDITIYRDISYDITPEDLGTPGEYKFHENPPPRCGLLLFFRLCLCPHLGLSSVWHFLSSFCCPSAGHIIGLTVPAAKSNLVPSRLGLLPERMFVLFHFSISFLLFSFFPSLFLLDTWYLILLSSCEVPDIYCCLRSRVLQVDHLLL